MTRTAPQIQPRLLGEAEAARYLGVSQTTLRGLGLPRRALGARRLYDILDLDAWASALPYEHQDGPAGQDQARCDAAFGGRA